MFNFDAMLRMPGAVDIRFSKVRYDFALGTSGEGGGTEMKGNNEGSQL